VSFAPQQTFPSSSGLYGFAGDFNGDGKVDLANVVSSGNSSALSVVLNMTPPGGATPVFTAPQTLTLIGPTDTKLVVGDLNGDGRPEVAVGVVTSTGILPSSLPAYLANTTPAGTASLSFSNPTTVDLVSGYLGAIALADFNGDGRPELVYDYQAGSSIPVQTLKVAQNVTPPGSSTISLAANYMQTFALSSALNARAGDIVVGDFNGDGKPDLAVENGFGVSVLLDTTPPGAGYTTLAAPQTFAMGSATASLAVADLNGDGRADLIFPDYSSNVMTVLLSTTVPGSTTPTFAAPQTFALSAGAVTVADLDGDGRPDLAAITGDGTVTVLTNTTPTGSGTVSFAQQTFAVGSRPFGLSVFDFNSDGQPDLCVQNVGDNTVSVLENTTRLVAVPQSISVVENTPEAVTLGGVAPNGDPLSFTVTANPAHGILSGTAPNLTYTPTTNYTGGDSFQYTVTDTVTHVTSAPATVGIAVTQVPTAAGQSLIVGENLTKAVTLSSTAPNGDPVSYTITAQPAHGTLSGTAPVLTYTPASNYTGPDSFRFTVTDNTTHLTSAPANVTFTVVPPPTAAAQSALVAQGQAKNLTLAGTPPNGDSLLFNIVSGSGPAHGTLGSLNVLTGAVTYTPTAGYTGSDSFQFTVTGTMSLLTSSAASVSLTVVQPPTATAQAVSVSQGQAKPITLAGTAPNGDLLSFTVTANPAHGTLSGTTPNLTYTPGVNYTGPDTFQFTATDLTTGLTSSAATVSLIVAQVPAATGQAVTVGENTAKGITLTGVAPNGDPLSFTVTAAPAHGTLSGTTPSLTYAPATSYTGFDSFRFTVTDTTTGLTSAPATVRITVSGVVAGQFGNQGVWIYNRTGNSWTQLLPANAVLLAADAQGDVVGEFSGYGVWEYTPGSGWKQLTTVDAGLLVMDVQGDVTGEFPHAGVWQYTPGSGWKQLATPDASLLAAGASGAVVGEFQGAGVWDYQPGSGWKQLTTVDAALLVMDAQGDVTGEFPHAGVWQYAPGSGWKQLTTVDAAVLAAGSSGEVVGDFHGAGVWRYLAASGWQQLTSAEATLLGDAGGLIYGEFFGSALWEFDPAKGWARLTSADATLLAVA
jgi:hypothetical protein